MRGQGARRSGTRQGGELARWRVLRQRRPPAAPELLAARDMSRGVRELARWRVLRQRRPPAAPELLAARDMSRGVRPAREQ